MKRWLACVLAAALALSLAACGDGGAPAGTEGQAQTGDSSEAPAGGSEAPAGEDGGDAAEGPSMTKEEMLETAVAADEIDIGNALVENVANARQTYCGKVLEVTSLVSAIEEDCVTLGQVGSFLTVYLPEAEIANLQPQQTITVVGLTNDEIETETQLLNGTEWERQYLVMEQAYLVTDRYEFTGTPTGENDSYPGAWNVEFPGQAVQKVVYFEDGTDVSPYVGEEITFTAQVIDFQYYNAVIE